MKGSWWGILMRGSRGDRGYGASPLENHKLYGFLYRQCRTQGGGGTSPPSPKEALSALKKVHPHNNSAERKGNPGSTDRAVSVTRACK